MQTEQNKKFCHKLVFKSEDRQTIIYGIILKEDSNFIFFKTAKKEYQINRVCILSLEPTNRPFISQEGGT